MVKKLTKEHFFLAVAKYLDTTPGTLAEATGLYDDLGMDSLGMFSLGMHLINILSISIPLSEVSTIVTLGDMYVAFETHQGMLP